MNSPENTGKNVWKKEPILGGETVKYANASTIEDYLAYDFTEEKNKKYGELNDRQRMESFTRFSSNIWQVHPFMEGNTRTTAVLMEQYFRSLGYEADNSLFKDNSLYFRNALVRANYADLPKGIGTESRYLERFYGNLLLQKSNKLEMRELFLPDVLLKAERDTHKDHAK